jgi:hypothetical protein
MIDSSYESHKDFIERWALFVKNNPKKWKAKHTKFIDAQFLMHKRFLRRLKNTPEGRKKIIELYRIKNLHGYEGLLS